MNQFSSVSYSNSNNCGNTTNSNNNEFNSYNISISDEKRQILEWLSPLASRERHQAVRDARVDGVGDWLLRDRIFSAWRISGDRTVKPVLLCYGDPGVGKTFASSLVIDTLSNGSNGDGVAVTYVYCDFGARKVQSPSTVLGSVLRQIVGALAETPDEVQEAFQRARRQVDGCGLRTPEILDMLVKYLPSLKRVFICIDALDEFPTKQRAQLWKSLQRVVRECPNARLFLTGRPQIKTEVENCFPKDADMVTINPTPADIRIYIEKRLGEDLDMSAMDNELRADVLGVVPGRVSGIFLLVCINMDAILAAPTIHQKRQALHRMAKGLDLQDAYNTTLDRIRQQGGSKSKLGMEVLMWISRCERPLKPAELGHALGVELGMEVFNTYNIPSIRTILDCTLGLVVIDEKASSVRLLHHTLQEYLGGHPALFVTSHSMMAEICLTYLNSQLVRTLQANLEKALEIAPFLEYATCFWGTHAAKEVTESVTYLALQLLDGYENHVSADILWLKRIRRRAWEGTVKGINGLHCIALWGVEEVAISMLEAKRWDVNGRDSKGDTPLMWAVRYGNNNIVKLFLEQKDINPDAALRDGRTVFSVAAELGNEGAVKLLLAHRGVDPNSPDKDGQTPLLLAALGRREGVARLLLERNDVNPNSPDDRGLTPLLHAARDGQEGLVQLLLEHSDIDPDSPDSDGWKPLSLAALRGHGGIVKLLLEREDVNPDSPDSVGQTPLSLATSGGHEGVVKLLLAREDVDPDLPDSEGWTPLSFAASKGHEGIVKLLLYRGGVNPDSRDSYGLTPLSCAALNGHEDVVKLLLEHGGVNPNSPDRDDQTPLGLAALVGEQGIVKLLLECEDVNPNSPDSDGRTPLSHAASSRYEDVVKLLLEREDVNPNSPDSDGRTPLSHAASSRCEGVVKLLLEREDVDPDLPDRDGCTPLSFAVSIGHEGVVKLLLERADVNPDSLDSDGRTPLSIAASRGYEDMVEILLESGASNCGSLETSWSNANLYNL